MEIIIKGIDDIINTDENVPDFNDPQEAFENAIEKGIFSEVSTFDYNKGKQENFVGDWMYMHSDNTKKIDYFKNKITRKYIEVSYEN